MIFPPEQVYQQRCDKFDQQRSLYEQRSRRNGNLNLILAIATMICLGLAIWRGNPGLYLATGALAVGFVVSFSFHARVNRLVSRYRILADINEQGIFRLQRTWNKMRRPGPFPTAQQPALLDSGTADDLDLLGYASLEHLLATPNTPVGKATLRQWILTPAGPETVRQRQAAVTELAPLIEFRDEVGLHGRLLGPSQGDYEQFMDWAGGSNWLDQRPWLIWMVRLLTLLVIGLGIALLLGVPTVPALLAVLLVNMLLTFTLGVRAKSDVERVAARQNVFRAYAGMFELISDQPFKSPALRDLQQQLAAGDLSAADQMRRLGRLMPLADIRRWMFFFIVEIFTLWSFHLLWLLERWQRSAGHQVSSWLAVLGEVEALIALATLRHDHPDWVFPEIVEHGAARLTVKALAHPLLPPAEAVPNDVVVGPPGSFLLVTGSNMSGKSTLLRAIGVNMVLAQMGGPVSASQLRLPPLAIATSMRVQDSLEQGVSYFMAELRRLKAIVDMADRQEERQGRPLLYLLDEILQGTNTSERRVAARQVINHLLATGAIGVVSTHDLTLADSPELTVASVPVHFTESFIDGADGPTMTFDYTLRPGIATSTNALKLMALVGLTTDN
ncbi:MAG: MutS family DNA mismatch repair protein [Chloroflexota bacterium]|nr:MutS family DNA mismatch repair protein [Chloroflexota bacterium]